MNALSERDSIVKVSKPAQELVRHGSIIYGETQARFIGRCLSFFYNHKEKELDAIERELFQEARENLEALSVGSQVEVIGGEDK
jgi:hypothetical protein